MSHAWYHVENEADIPSPALLFFRSRIEHNLRLMLKIAGDPNRLRPHVKTHKTAEIIAMQLKLGITRFKAATIAETEMCAAVGATDVLLAMPCVGINAHRLAELALKFPDTQFSSIADDMDTVRFLASAAQQHNVTLGVYLELDCGMSRTGIFPGDEAAILAHAMKDTPRLQFRGLHAYDGHIHDDSLDVRRERCNAAFEPVLQFRCRLQGEGIIVKELVAGGSPTFGIHATYPDRTLSPGTTVLWDFGYGDKYPADLPFQPAAMLLARVISKPGKNRITLDLGHKSVAPENPHPRVRFEELPDAVALMQSEEHLVLETDRAHEFTIGQALHGLPRHVCPTVSMHGEAYVIEGGQTTERWPITARNRLITV
jgi:D-serine deaminase-like pyridoxal phosphate-dependent protein|uniref:D-TA family PLP-dependent enzyme n=1 Tax=Prosthecobacter sp. TaxID=1965333 RepID=UPI003784252F